MQKIQGAPLALAGCLLILATGVARADLKVVQTTTLTNSQYAAMRDSMTANQKAAAHRAGMDLMMGIPQTNTIYISGQHFRFDQSEHHFIADTRANTITSVDIATKSYRLAPLTVQSTNFTWVVTSDKKHRNLVGHPASLYSIKGSSVTFPGEVITGKIWAADDIPIPTPASTGLPAQFVSILQQVKKWPLLMDLKVTGAPSGQIVLSSKTVSVSKAPLPAATFRVPAGYKPANPNAALSNPLMGMGGGF